MGARPYILTLLLTFASTAARGEQPFNANVVLETSTTHSG